MLATQVPILDPINVNHNEPIWLITDTSISGMGCMYGQGKDWKSLHLVGFHSHKFIPAQISYWMHKPEWLAIIEGLLKWEDKLLGQHFKVLTNHDSFKWLKTQPDLSQ